MLQYYSRAVQYIVYEEQKNLYLAIALLHVVGITIHEQKLAFILEIMTQLHALALL